MLVVAAGFWEYHEQQLLSDDMLVVNNVLDVFCALIRWLDYDRDGRLCQAANLLQNAVRLHCISPESGLPLVLKFLKKFACP